MDHNKIKRIDLFMTTHFDLFKKYINKNNTLGNAILLKLYEKMYENHHFANQIFIVHRVYLSDLCKLCSK